MDWPVDLDYSLGDTPSFRQPNKPIFWSLFLIVSLFFILRANLSFSEQDMHRLETLLEKVRLKLV